MMRSDFRGDTVAQPTLAMRKAMANAEVGDDVYGEDPTVRRLEERTAELLGMPAALFVPTGSMGNQVCLRVLARPATEVIVEAQSHVLQYEMAAMAALSGLLPRAVSAPKGRLTPALIAPHIRTGGTYYLTRTSVLSVENTHNVAGGTVLRPEASAELAEAAKSRGIATHLDGARLWNAAAALSVPESAFTKGFDAVMVCYSKGLRAPVGSAVAGSQDFIYEARRARKLLGGGMRQVGILAAAALVGLERERSRLPEDHARARRLAEALAELPGFTIDPAEVETNIVMCTVSANAPRLVEQLAERGVLAASFSDVLLRFVTHADIGDADVARAIGACRDLAGNAGD